MSNKVKAPEDQVTGLISDLAKDMSLRDYYDFLRDVRSDVNMLIDACECDIEAEEERSNNDD